MPQGAARLSPHHPSRLRGATATGPPDSPLWIWYQSRSLLLSRLFISAPIISRRSEGELLPSDAWLSFRLAWRTQSRRDTVGGVRAQALRNAATLSGVSSKRFLCRLEPWKAFLTLGGTDHNCGSWAREG